MQPKLDATPSANPASDNTQRKPDGKFAKGNVGGPGNPFARKSAFLRMIALESTTEQDIREIFAALKFKAITGDIAAAKILLSYTIGTPQPAVDPDTINKHEIETMVANTVTDEDVITKLLQANSLDLLLPLLRFLLPEMLETNRKQALEELAKPIVPPAPPPPPPAETPTPESASASEPQNVPACLHEGVEKNKGVAPPGIPTQQPTLSTEDVERMRELAKEMAKLAQKQKDEAQAPPSPNGFSDSPPRDEAPPSPNGVSDRPPMANGFQRPPTNLNAKAPITNGV